MLMVFSRRKRCPSQGVGPSVAHHRLPLKAPSAKKSRTEPLPPAPLENAGGALCPALGERRAAAGGCAKGPKRHPDPKKTPARSGTAPRAGPEAAPQRPKRWTNLVCLIFASG